MNRREFMGATLAGVVGHQRLFAVASQANRMQPDLAAFADRQSFKLVNRTAQPLADGARKGVRLTAAEGEGLAFLPDIAFSGGTIELDLRGKDVAQQSFLGIAFYGGDDGTFDALYFRPFNFKAADPASRGHAVQYHSLPLYTWQKLRTEQPGKYEHAVDPAPDPNAWFRARFVIANAKATVFVGETKDPCLTVDLLGNRKSGLVGLWVGNNSGGDFANLAIIPSA